jgi:epoxyqueuosine reductase QueG
MTVINARLMPDAEIKSCIVFLVPYRTEYMIRDNYGISLYARSQDYHRFFGELYGRILPFLEALFPGEKFFGFADHSPVNEKLAAAKAGLGRIGRNSLLINEKYGSYVFIGSLLTTLPLPAAVREIKGCDNCGVCADFCPVKAIGGKGIAAEKCLSHISQKKSKNENELALLRKNNIVWGCDICQTDAP